MASLAASVIASMVIDDMLKDDGGKEVAEMMGGGYKFTKQRLNHHLKKMGSALTRVAVRQALRKGGQMAAKRLTKQAVKRLAIKGAKSAAKAAAAGGIGLAADAILKNKKINGNGSNGKVKKRMKRMNSKRKRLLTKQLIKDFRILHR